VRYAIKGFFWFGIEHSVSTLTGIATSVAFANLLLPETYGVFKYVLSLLPFLGLSTLNKLDDSLTISVAKGFEGDTINILKTKIKWGLLGSVAGLGLSLYYYFGNNQTLALLIAILAIFVPLFNTPLIYGNYLMGKKKFRTAAVINSVSSVIYSVAIIAAVLFSKNVFVIVLVYFIINTAIRFASFYYVIKKYPPNENKEEKTIDYGKKINVLEIINTISASIDNILVFHYLGAAELAAYAFIKKVPENLKFIPRFLTTLSTPKFSQNDIGNPKVKKEVVRKTIIFYSGMALIILAYILAAPFIFNLLFKPYKEYVLYSQIYAFSFALNFGGLYLNFLETTRRVRSVISLHLTTSLLSIIVMLVSLRFYGLLGLVVGYSIIRFFSSVIRYIYFKKAESVI
jgi:O-antigen/teichoic acid export membrane protein